MKKHLKHLLIALAILFVGQRVFAQNVGIGTITPTFPLTVVPDINGIGIVQKKGTVEMGFFTNTTTGAWLKTFSNHNLNFTTNHVTGNPDPTLIINTNGNVGINTGGIAPAFKLDINGRMRIRHNSTLNQTAGIWMDGLTLPTRSFWGTYDENYVGIYGGGGAGWNIAMNVANGNTGIGTTAPTADLDINGALRIRNNGAKTGSKLASTDANGNATWQAPVAFRAWGSADGNATDFTSYGFIKYYYSSSTDYNLGLHFNALNSEFIAPYDGMYHFDAQVKFELENRRANIGIFVVEPDGYPVVKAKYSNTDNGTFSPESFVDVDIVTENVAKISLDIRLNAGEKVHVEIDRQPLYGVPGIDRVSADIRLTWFSGHLISRL